MKAKQRFIDRFMKATGKTSIFLGPAHRAPVTHRGKHAKKSAEEVEAINLAENTWEIKTLPDGGHYIVERPPVKTGE